ncbi:MAG: alpha/beta hydrolase fold domain-containing protein [Streptosporangiales bacterium]|nr:alpha/beta hydrolase fold domain-containing protein [Streptosporangiales bacterium]
MELRHLRAFVAVAEELNFGRAATRLYVSQPALSRQIRALERLLGCDLLRRSTHRVELTLAGESLLARTRDLLSDLDDAVSATRTVGGEHTRRAAVLWGAVQEASVIADADLQQMRDAYESVQQQFAPPPEVRVRSVNAGGVPSLLLGPGEDHRATTLFLHGGGGVMGSAFGYQPLVGALAAAADTGVMAAEYRLAPEHPFPAALEDALSAYLWLLDRGVAPEQVTVAGDSFGGSMALGLLLSLRRRDLPLPGGALFLCPGLDPRLTALAKTLSGEDLAKARKVTELYLDGHSPDDPLVNPLTADLAGLPPLLVQAATRDPSVDDAHRLVERATDCGVEVKLELYPVETHIFQIFWPFLPEAADAVQRAGRFLQAGTARATAPGTLGRAGR